jgi:RES domain-containing protein
VTQHFWRISGDNSLSGEGGLLYSARWHTIGRRIVYLAESPPGALIETLVHAELNHKDWPRFYDLMQVATRDNVQMESLAVPPTDEWRRSDHITRMLGDAWLLSGATALARVPSAILPDTWNVLLNPRHPEAAQVAIVKVTRVDYDLRLFRQDL